MKNNLCPCKIISFLLNSKKNSIRDRGARQLIKQTRCIHHRHATVRVVGFGYEIEYRSIVFVHVGRIEVGDHGCQTRASCSVQ